MWTIIELISKNPEISLSSRNNPEMSQRSSDLPMLVNFSIYMSYFAYVCKTEGKNGISRLISALCVNCLISIPEYSRLNHLDVYLV